MNNNKTIEFWFEEKDKIRISQSKILEFLQINGFARVKLADDNHENVRLRNNKMKIVSKEEITDFIKNYLVNTVKRIDVFEVFARGVGQYVNDQKISLLDKIENIDDRDPKNKATFYFKCFL